MKNLMKKTGIYLLAFMVAVVSPGCTSTQAVTSEPPASTSQQISNASESETSQAQENQPGTVPEEKITEGESTSAAEDTAGKVVLGVLATALGVLLFVVLESALYVALWK